MSEAIIEIGKYNTLEVVKSTDFGLYLGDSVEEILLPLKWVPEGTEVGDRLEVFIYTDSEDRIIATTMKPKLVVGEFAMLEVVDVSGPGAFLNMGLEKDLLVPFKEQSHKMQVGEKHLIQMYLDEVTDRLVGTSHYQRFLTNEMPSYEVNEEVEILVFQDTDLGFKVLINQKFIGLVYSNEIFDNLEIGDKRAAYIKKVREDGKIDVSLQKAGYVAISSNAENLLEKLRTEDGFLALHDKSAPEDIYDALKMSKKNFKKAVGSLYKEKIIRIGDKGIELVKRNQ